MLELPPRVRRAVAVLAVVIPSVRASSGAEPVEPHRRGLVERAEVVLLLLDVEAADKRGRPMPGLTKQDFRVRLGVRDWEIYSVDDLCPCGSRTEAASAAGAPDPGGGTAGDRGDAGRPVPPQDESAHAPSPAPEPAEARAEPITHVLYLDFSRPAPGTSP